MGVREAIPREEEAQEGVSSFAKSLFLGEIHEELVFPWPPTDADEQDKVRDAQLAASASTARRTTTRGKAEEERWIPDEVLRDLGEIGALGLYVDEAYGGQGLSQTGYARVFETVGQIDATLAIVLGVHQSIGFKGISLFGTDEQKERWLPDLAAGRKLAAFALTEPEAGSDAYHVQLAGGPAAGRVLGPERGEALHRQRLPRRRDHHLRPRRDRRRGPPHRAASWRRGWRASRSASASTRWGCRPTTFAASTSRTSGCRPRTCSASPARASGSRCRSSTTAASASAPARSAAPRSCST